MPLLGPDAGRSAAASVEETRGKCVRATFVAEWVLVQRATQLVKVCRAEHAVRGHLDQLLGQRPSRVWEFRFFRQHALD